MPRSFAGNQLALLGDVDVVGDTTVNMQEIDLGADTNIHVAADTTLTWNVDNINGNDSVDTNISLGGGKRLRRSWDFAALRSAQTDRTVRFAWRPRAFDITPAVEHTGDRAPARRKPAGKR